jgi:hypothetical protein
MPSVTRLARDVAAKIWPVVTTRSQQGWRWLTAPRDPLPWADLRAKLTTLKVPNTYAGRLALLGGGVLLLLLVLLWYAAEQKDDKGAVTYPHAGLINPILGGLGALFLIYAAIRQARTATEVARTGNRQAEIASRRHVTDTFSKAVEQLGDDKLEVRIGGIYTLERLAQEALVSSPDANASEGASDLYWTAMETLTAFVRERARWQGPKAASVGMADKSDYLWPSDVRSATQPDDQPPPEPAADIAAVIAVIRRRPEAGREREKRRGWRFDMRALDLRGAALNQAHLEDARLHEAHLEGANLSGAHLERAILYRAHLDGAYPVEAHLEDADLYGAHLEDAKLYEAHLERARLCLAHLERANLLGAHLEGANLSGAEGLTQGQVYRALGDAKTLLPEGLTRPAHWTQPERGADPAA